MEHLFYNRLFTLPTGRSVCKNDFRHPGVTTIAALLSAVEYRGRGLFYSYKLADFFDRLSFGAVYNNKSHFIITPTREYRFEEVTLKLLYELLLTNGPLYKPHHHRTKWCNKLEKDLDWDKIWSSVHNPLALTNTCSAVWEQIHLNFYTTYNYNKWHNDSQLCPLCTTRPETIFHIILECPLVTQLWLDLEPTLQLITPQPVTYQELAFGLSGHTKQIHLRNWLTYILREVVTQFEAFAHHNQQGLANADLLKPYYNNKLSSYIAYWFYYYKHIGRPDLFTQKIAFTDAITVVRPDGSLFIKDVFQINNTA